MAAPFFGVLLVSEPDRVSALVEAPRCHRDSHFATGRGRLLRSRKPATIASARRDSRGDELGVLVDRFNEMLAGIQSRDNNLRTALHDREEALRDAEKARERFRFMAESMPQKIFTATPDGDVDYFNRQWMEFTGSALRADQGLGLDSIRASGRS